MGILVALYFFEADCLERDLNFSWEGCDLHRNYGMVEIFLSFLRNYDNLTVKLHHEKRSYPDERWLFSGRFKVGSVPGKKVTLVGSKKVSKSIMSMMQGH